MRFLAALFLTLVALASPALAQSDTRNDPDIGVYAFSGGDSSLNSDAN
jgi:hypothetical protein